jgi:acyl-CoA reductase-like NAD-dependent aldehyde dehydrogenase
MQTKRQHSALGSPDRSCPGKGRYRISQRGCQALRFGRLLIDGRWRDAEGERFIVHHPASNEEVGSIACATVGEVDEAVNAARRAFDQGPWPRMRASERRRPLLRVANAIGAHGEELTLLQTLENGVPLSFSATGRLSGHFPAEIFQYHAGWIDGSPFDFATTSAALVNRQQLARVLDYIEGAKADGAELVCGGRQITEDGLGNGNFVAPTIFVGVRNDMRVAQEEIFGPVLVVIPFATEEEAIEIANDSDYGSQGASTRGMSVSASVSRQPFAPARSASTPTRFCQTHRTAGSRLRGSAVRADGHPSRHTPNSRR